LQQALMDLRVYPTMQYGVLRTRKVSSNRIGQHVNVCVQECLWVCYVVVQKQKDEEVNESRRHHVTCSLHERVFVLIVSAKETALFGCLLKRFACFSVHRSEIFEARSTGDMMK
jgi:hypothetical protein